MVTEAAEPRTVRILPRGNWMDDSGEVVEPAVPAFLPRWSMSRDGLRRGSTWPAGWSPAEPADRPRLRQPPVEAHLRPGPRSHAGRLRLAGRLADASGTARLAGRRVRRQRLGRQAHGPADGDSRRPTARRRRRRPSLRRRDPYNQLLARQGRFRLDAEMVRDNALAVSGLLVRHVGGPSVKPYQPAGYWAHLNFPTREYQSRPRRRPVPPRPVHVLVAAPSCTRACWPSTPRGARNVPSSGRGRTRRCRRWCC